MIKMTGTRDHHNNATPLSETAFWFSAGSHWVNKKDYTYKMVSANIEHASFNILCCVVKKWRKNYIVGMRLNSVAALLTIVWAWAYCTFKNCSQMVKV